MSVVPYAAPSVTSAGLVVPNYQSILNDNIQQFLNIFGQNQYVGQDSAIYQLISVFSLKLADTNAGLQLAVNQMSPQTAVGAGLDRCLKYNGLARAAYTYSTCAVTLYGTAGTEVKNGSAQDVNGNIWALPTLVTIAAGGTSVTATCTTPGNTTAEIGDIKYIATPVSGWSSVTNLVEATAGNSVETDSQARARQAISVALPSVTRLASTVAAVLAVPGVKRIAPGYPTPGGPGSSIENPTGSTDSWGNPAHSISMVVDGGADADVAMAIYGARGIGCYTNGNTSVAVADPNTGYPMTIRYWRPTYLNVFVLATIHGYNVTPTTATISKVQTAIINYLNALAIGETASVGAINYTAMSVNTSLAQPSFGVTSLLIGTAAASPTGNTTNGSTAVTVSSGTGIATGQLVFGSGVPSGTTVSAVSGTSVTLSAAATATASGVQLYFVAGANSDVTMPNYYDVAQGSTVTVEVITA